MTDIGYAALSLTLVVSIYATVAFIVGGRWGYPELLESAKNAVLAAGGLATIASAVLIYLLLTHDFGVRYVYQHTSTYLPTVYTLSAFWAGQEGSLLLWLWLLAILTAIVALLRQAWSQELQPYALAFLAFSEAFLALVLVFVSDPFAEIPRPVEGFGLNPLLQNFWMIIHPPVVFVGYAAYTIPFAFAFAALVSDHLDDQWVRGIRRWNILAWLFLGLGILIGAWWAYLELGWGGYWGWDPVENASLIPWLTGTAFLHSVMMQERRGMFKVWNIVLITLTFTLCIFATFVTRSGIIKSVHAFGQSSLGAFFLAFMAIVLAVIFGLLYHRQQKLASENEPQSLISREANFLLNNLLLCGGGLAILLGTIFPTLTELVQGEQISLNASFYRRVMGPVFAALLLLIGICPLIGWRRIPSAKSLRVLLYPAVTALLIAVALFTLEIREPYALLSFAICAFVMTAILSEFYRGMMARRRTRGEPPLKALVTLIWKARRRYGGYLVHLSIVLIALGVTGESFYKIEKQLTLTQGESITIEDYVLQYEAFSSERTQEKQRFAVTLNVYKNDRKIDTVVPEKNFHWNIEQWVTEVAIHRSLKEDLYIILGGIEEDGLATFQILINPLVIWLWIGGGVLLLGTVVAAWPSMSGKQVSL